MDWLLDKLSRKEETLETQRKLQQLTFTTLSLVSDFILLASRKKRKESVFCVANEESLEIDNDHLEPLTFICSHPIPTQRNANDLVHETVLNFLFQISACPTHSVNELTCHNQLLQAVKWKFKTSKISGYVNCLKIAQPFTNRRWNKQVHTSRFKYV